MTTSSHQTTDASRWPVPTVRRGLVAVIATLLCLAVPSTAHASLLSPELEDKLATILALVVIFIVPVVLIVLFWLVHILPEKIAHKRHHPQFEAIRTLCLLSLVFGGLLWPIAWIWAYSKPVLLQDGVRDGQGPCRLTMGSTAAGDGRFHARPARQARARWKRAAFRRPS